MQQTILAVDDEPEVLSMLEEYLGSRGFRVLTATRADEARAILGAERVDLAMLDINMPGEDGLSLARYLRERNGPAIIMLTALDSVVDRVVGLVPPCVSTIPRLTARPMPVPMPAGFVVKYGSKIRERIPSGIPGPLSAISTRTPARSRSAAIRIRRGGGQLWSACCAFTIRFRNT